MTSAADPHPTDPFRVLLCLGPGTTAAGPWGPGLAVALVTTADLSAGPAPTSFKHRWPHLACRLAVVGKFACVVLAEAAGDVTADVAAVAEAIRSGGGEVVRIAPSAGGAAGWLLGRPAGPAAVRGYATALLGRVPFELNGPAPVFDLHLLCQAVHVGAPVCDLPGHTTAGPARPGSSIRTAVRYRLHQFGVLSALRYRDLTPSRYRDKTFMMYTSHALALRLVRAGRPRTLLDVGCGPGFIAARCRAEGVRVTGLDAHDPLPGSVDDFHRVDLDRDRLPVDPFAYDDVLMLDVVEHLADPESFLVGLRNRGEVAHDRGGPRVILSTPNVAFVAVRLNLLLGRFTYAERGILDVTHKRLFTRRSLLTMLRDCGYAVEQATAVGPPFQTVLGGRLGLALGAITDALARAWPSLFAFQFMVVARPQPGVRQLLRDRPHLLAAVTDGRPAAAVP